MSSRTGGAGGALFDVQWRESLHQPGTLKLQNVVSEALELGVSDWGEPAKLAAAFTLSFATKSPYMFTAAHIGCS
eukprot:1136373-Pelagomonas_calceolata.AAC.4